MHSVLSLAMVAPAQAVPFADDEELGEAWHAVVGFTRAVPTEQQMHSLLVDNLMFALRCAASPDSFFFGPTRDLLPLRPAGCVHGGIFPAFANAHIGQVALFAGTSKQSNDCMLPVVWASLLPKPLSVPILEAEAQLHPALFCMC